MNLVSFDGGHIGVVIGDQIVDVTAQVNVGSMSIDVMQSEGDAHPVWDKAVS